MCPLGTFSLQTKLISRHSCDYLFLHLWHVQPEDIQVHALQDGLEIPAVCRALPVALCGRVHIVLWDALLWLCGGLHELCQVS